MSNQQSNRSKKDRIWTAEEDEKLIEFYPQMKGRCFCFLTAHSTTECRNRVRVLGLNDEDLCPKGHNKHWTPNEDRIILNYYPAEGKRVIDRLPGRTVASCQLRAYMLGIGTRPGHFPGAQWTKEEDAILKEFYPLDGQAVVQKLPWRSVNAIATRARSLGVKRYYGPRAPSDVVYYSQYTRRQSLH